MIPALAQKRLSRLPAPEMVYRIKITLERISPSIWRRIDVAESCTLLKLHHILQIVMGSEDCHLYRDTRGPCHG